MDLHAVVVIVSPDSVRNKHLMAEPSAALARCNQQALCPVFYGLSVEECSSIDFRGQYYCQPWEISGLTEPGVLDAYAQTNQELCKLTDVRQDKVCLPLCSETSGSLLAGPSPLHQHHSVVLCNMEMPMYISVVCMHARWPCMLYMLAG